MSKRALLVIDLQVGVEAGEKKLYQLDQVIGRVNEQIEQYRKDEQPIIFIQHEDEDLVVGSPSWELFSALQVESTDYFIGKTHANSFYQTMLGELLEQLDVKELEICGAQTEYCVDTTIRMAHGLGYQLFMRKGTVTTVDNARLTAPQIIAHHEAIWDKRFLTVL